MIRGVDDLVALLRSDEDAAAHAEEAATLLWTGGVFADNPLAGPLEVVFDVGAALTAMEDALGSTCSEVAGGLDDIASRCVWAAHMLLHAAAEARARAAALGGDQIVGAGGDAGAEAVLGDVGGIDVDADLMREVLGGDEPAAAVERGEVVCTFGMSGAPAAVASALRRAADNIEAGECWHDGGWPTVTVRAKGGEELAELGRFFAVAPADDYDPAAWILVRTEREAEVLRGGGTISLRDEDGCMPGGNLCVVRVDAVGSSWNSYCPDPHEGGR